MATAGPSPRDGGPSPSSTSPLGTTPHKDGSTTHNNTNTNSTNNSHRRYRSENNVHALFAQLDALMTEHDSGAHCQYNLPPPIFRGDTPAEGGGGGVSKKGASAGTTAAQHRTALGGSDFGPLGVRPNSKSDAKNAFFSGMRRQQTDRQSVSPQRGVSEGTTASSTAAPTEEAGVGMGSHTTAAAGKLSTAERLALLRRRLLLQPDGDVTAILEGTTSAAEATKDSSAYASLSEPYSGGRSAARQQQSSVSASGVDGAPLSSSSASASPAAPQLLPPLHSGRLPQSAPESSGMTARQRIIAQQLQLRSYANANSAAIAAQQGTTPQLSSAAHAESADDRPDDADTLVNVGTPAAHLGYPHSAALGAANPSLSHSGSSGGVRATAVSSAAESWRLRPAGSVVIPSTPTPDAHSAEAGLGIGLMGGGGPSEGHGDHSNTNNHSFQQLTIQQTDGQQPSSMGGIPSSAHGGRLFPRHALATPGTPLSVLMANALRQEEEDMRSAGGIGRRRLGGGGHAVSVSPSPHRSAGAGVAPLTEADIEALRDTLESQGYLVGDAAALVGEAYETLQIMGASRGGFGLGGVGGGGGNGGEYSPLFGGSRAGLMSQSGSMALSGREADVDDADGDVRAGNEAFSRGGGIPSTSASAGGIAAGGGIPIRLTTLAPTAHRYGSVAPSTAGTLDPPTTAGASLAMLGGDEAGDAEEEDGLRVNAVREREGGVPTMAVAHRSNTGRQQAGSRASRPPSAATSDAASVQPSGAHHHLPPLRPASSSSAAAAEGERAGSDRIGVGGANSNGAPLSRTSSRMGLKISEASALDAELQTAVAAMEATRRQREAEREQRRAQRRREAARGGILERLEEEDAVGEEEAEGRSRTDSLVIAEGEKGGDTNSQPEASENHQQKQQPAKRSGERAPPKSPRTIRNEQFRAAMARAEAEDREELTSEEDTMRERLARDAEASAEAATIVFESRRRAELKRLQMRLFAADDDAKERERRRIFEFVRDCLFDEEHARPEVIAAEAAARVLIVESFSATLRSDVFQCQVDERLNRLELFDLLESEERLAIYECFVEEGERRGRAAIAATWLRGIEGPYRAAQEAQARDEALLDEAVGRVDCEDAEEVDRFVLREMYITSLVPLITRESWRVVTAEAEGRLRIEREEPGLFAAIIANPDDNDAPFERSRPMVRWYAQTVSRARKEWAEHLAAKAKACADAELSGRLLAHQEQREEWILLTETFKRDGELRQAEAQRREEFEARVAIAEAERRREAEERLAQQGVEMPPPAQPPAEVGGGKKRAGGNARVPSQPGTCKKAAGQAPRGSAPKAAAGGAKRAPSAGSAAVGKKAPAPAPKRAPSASKKD